MGTRDTLGSDDFSLGSTIGASASFDDSFDEEDHRASESKREHAADVVPSTRALEADKARLEALFAALKTSTATVAHRAEMAGIMRRLESATLTRTVTRERERAGRKAELRKMERLLEVKSVLKAAAKAESVLLCFLVDCTGSMHRSIEAVKRDVRALVTEMHTKYAAGVLRVAFVGYRDFSDGALRLEQLDFTKDVGAFETFVQGIRAQGGGDAAEDVVGGLAAAAQLDWGAAGNGTTRVLVHIADAPAHGARYHGSEIDDKYSGSLLPPGGAAALDPLPQLLLLRDLKVQYYFGELTRHTRKMVKAFNEDIGGEEPFVSTTSMNPAELASTVTSVLRSSVMKTAAKASAAHVTFRVDAPAGLSHRGASRMTGIPTVIREEDEESDGGMSVLPEPDSFDAAMPDWEHQPKYRTEVLTNAPINSLRQLRRRNTLHFGAAEPTDGTKAKSMVSRIATRPFAEGNCRYAFHAQLQTSVEFKGFVVKRFKGDRGHILSRYRDQIEVSTIAAFLAEQFNASSRFPAGAKPVRFLKSHVLKVHIEEGRPQLFTAERPLPLEEPTSFVKFSNNTGHWIDPGAHPVLLEFSKFTYQATSGYMMVVDLQGVETDACYQLTDPVILCEDLDRFGATNLGTGAMKRCIRSIRAHLGDA